MEQEMILEDEIMENYSLDGIYEEIEFFSEVTPKLTNALKNPNFLQSMKIYFQFKTL